MRHEKKFEVFPRPKFTVLYTRLLNCSEEFARPKYPCLIPMTRHPLRPPLFKLWSLVPRMTAAVKPRKHTLSTFAITFKIETHILGLVNVVDRFEKINII
jgi:hypothetical protein